MENKKTSAASDDWMEQLSAKKKKKLSVKNLKNVSRKAWIILGASVLAAGALAAALFLFILPATASADAEATYREYTVAYGDITVGQTESSSVSLNRETVTFPVSATVEEIYVKAGSSVKEGDPLVKMNVEEIQTGLASYELTLEVAGLELEQAKLSQQTKLLQAEQALETSLLTGKLADDTEAYTMDELQLTLTNAQSALADAQEDYYDYCKLNATFEQEYDRLTTLKEQVTYYTNLVTTAKSDLESVTNSNDAYTTADSTLTSAKNGLVSVINRIFSYTSYAPSQTLGTDNVLSYIVLSTGIGGVDTSDEEAVASAIADAASLELGASSGTNLVVNSTDLETIQNYASTIESAVQTLNNNAYTSPTATTATLSSYQSSLSTYTASYNDYKEYFDDKYGNISGVEDMISALEDAQAAAEKAQLALDKAEVSAETGTTTAEQKKDTSENAAEVAQTTYDLTVMELSQAVDAAQEDYDTLLTQIEEVKELISEDGIVYAPCNGMVASISVEEGDSVTVYVDEDTNQIMSYATLLVMTDISKVYVPITISEEDVLDVYIGQPASVSMTAFTGRTFDAEVDTITVESSRSGAATVSYTVNVVFSEDNELDMYEGMSADVTLVQRAATDVLYVEAAAVSNTDGVATVLQRDSDGNMVHTVVKTGFSDGRYVEILDGLNEGDVVLAKARWVVRDEVIRDIASGMDQYR